MMSSNPARWRVLEWIYYVTAILSAEAAWSLRASDPKRAIFFLGFMMLSLAMAFLRRRQRMKSTNQQ